MTETPQRDTCPRCGEHVPSPGTARSIESGLSNGGEEETWQDAVCDSCGTALQRLLGDAIWMVAPQQPKP
jgi:hypothetical protein